MLNGIFAALFSLAAALSITTQTPSELTETLEIPDFEFSLMYPTGYTLTAAEDGHKLPPGVEPESDAYPIFMDGPTRIERAYFMTEFASDVEAAMDDDYDTVPEGTVIYLLVSPLADWSFDQTTSVFDMARPVTSILNMALFGRFPTAVMGRAAVICKGVPLSLDAERSTTHVVWTDDGYVFVLGFDTTEPLGSLPLPDEEFVPHPFLKAVLDSVRSTPMAPLTRDVKLGDSGYVFSVPATWTVEPNGTALYLSGYDMRGGGTGPAKVMLMVVDVLSRDFQLAQFGSAFETTEEVIQFFSEFPDEAPALADIYVADQHTLEMRGRMERFNRHISIVPFMVGEYTVSFVQLASNSDEIEHFEATFQAILASVRLAPADKD